MNKEYYKAYEERYKDTYKNNTLWETRKITKEVINTIKKYKITKEDKILEIGCGEGRDSIYLLEHNYHNLLGIDYSKTVINKCNELTNNKYINNFKSLDIMEDKLNKKYKFIYSVAVLHMFITKEHRNKFYNFIYDHLEDNGIALIISMGDGITTYKSDITKAFTKVERENINTNKKVLVANTSCFIVDIPTIKEEITINNLKIIKTYISTKVPNFDKCICVVVAK